MSLFPIVVSVREVILIHSSNLIYLKIEIFKYKSTNVRRIALERQAGGKTFDPTVVRTIDLPLNIQMHCPLRYLALVFPLLQPTSNKLYFGVRAIVITHK